ncbi:hypothetical protein GCM10008904_10460 [Paraclostridium ghonii]|uniref:Uncharacterized protein n=1 Tax=Paraclostridium ghonii TaxID=29358 RepID=A0ABU0MYE4_9FIRM|nr:hypothetical protein [Paeniclostridium ghonii]MDQ0555925.1 hypothetical protein [Paeniclostridium ghonii]
MKKINTIPWEVIILTVILILVFLPKNLSSRVNLDNLFQNDLIIEVIHRNNLVESGTVTSTTDVTKLEELENFLDKYKSIPTIMSIKQLDDEESYTINFKNDDEFLTTIVLYKKNLEVMPGSDTVRRYSVIGENIDFNFLEQFVKSIN